MSPEIRNSAKPPAPVSVILIAYNEAQTIRQDVEDFHRTVVARVPGSELIVTEDGSTDGTSEILREIASRLPVRLVQGKERKGYIRALFDALKLASCEWIFFSDTGGKFRPDDFWKLEPERKSADLIVAVKTSRRDQWYRRMMTSVFNRLVSSYFHVSVHDIDSGFRLYRRSLMEGISPDDMVFRDLINAELSLRMLTRGARFREIPVIATAREDQSRGMPPKKIPRVIFQILTSFPRLKKAIIKAG
jgi:glycosyltransferase involved in cell wall biosynthesis